MRVGTNENVKVNDENIEITNVEEKVGALQNEKVENFQKFDETQRICLIDGLEKQTNFFREKILNEKINETNNVENLIIENQISSNESGLNQSVEDQSENNLNNIQIVNPQEKNVENKNETSDDTINKTQMEHTLVLNNIKELEKIEKNQEICNESVNDNNKINSLNEDNITINVSENIDDKEKKHTQDKKDYRFEKMLFDKINAMQGKIKESLELIKKFERINAKEENLPNIVTTLHDKLTQEVIKQFRTVGIEFNMKSYLVQAIVSDLLNKFEEGISEFKDCSENLNFVKEVQDDFESRVELVSTSKVKNIIARLRGMFKPERKQEKLEQLERERQEKKLEEANIHLIKYKFKNSELEKYTIKNNICGSLTREILNGHSSGLNLTLQEFINQKISPEIEKLGLQYVVPELIENLFNEYKEKNSDINKENFINITVGEIKRNMKTNKIEYVRTKVTEINSKETEEIAV